MDVDEILSEDELEDEVVVPPSGVGWIFNEGEEGDADDWEHYFDGEDKEEDDDQHNNCLDFYSVYSVQWKAVVYSLNIPLNNKLNRIP